jgi:hypothetical protein
MVNMPEKMDREFDLEAARSVLERALEGEDVGRVTKAEKIAELRPQIVALKAKGYTWEQVAALLESVGGVSKDTLRHAVGRIAEKKGGSKRKGAAVRPTRTAMVSVVGKKKEPTEPKQAALAPEKAGSGGHGSRFDLGG